jgi:hypothetical protein
LCQTLASRQWLAPLQDGNEELYKANSIGNVNFVVNPQSPTQSKEKSEWSHRNDANDTESKLDWKFYKIEFVIIFINSLKIKSMYHVFLKD